MKDIRYLFPLGEYVDNVEINCHDGEMFNGIIVYNTRRSLFIEGTLAFCTLAGMDDVTTLQWVLKYGDKLPTRINEIEGELHD